LGITQARIEELQEQLHNLLGPELSQIVQMMADENSATSPFVTIPVSENIDLSPQDIANLVARASNAYVRASRLNGIARAELKLAEGDYKRKLKQSMGTGKNKEERESNALAAAASQHAVYITLEALVELSQSAENSARIASESARKLLDKVSNMAMGQVRESRGHYTDGF
jgi:hypothetical protein